MIATSIKHFTNVTRNKGKQRKKVQKKDHNKVITKKKTPEEGTKTEKTKTKKPLRLLENRHCPIQRIVTAAPAESKTEVHRT